MKKVLLLDFDGSFFKHKSANSIITNRARYVKKIINVNNEIHI
jgi:hypothetical protein